MKHYTRPVIVSQKSFETSALACIKTPGGGSMHAGAGTTYITGSGDIGNGTFHLNTGYSSTSLPCDYLLNVS